MFSFGNECGHRFFGIDSLLSQSHISDCLNESLKSAGISNFAEYHLLQSASPLPYPFRSVGLMSSVHITIKSENDRLLEQILRQNDEAIHFKDKLGRTPLHYACIFTSVKSKRIFKILMKFKPNIFVRDIFGYTAFMYACQSNRIDFMLELMSQNIDIIICRDENLNTALHLAVEKNFEVLARLLLLHGAAVFQENDEGKSSIDIALQNKNVNMFEMLRSAGYNSNKKITENSQWLHGKINKRKAKALILNEAWKMNKSSGVFLVRNSEKYRRRLVISLLVGNHIVRHFFIMIEVSNTA